MKHDIFLNFLCLGTQKAGTTLLYKLLRQHPQIYLPNEKEAHFFDIDDNFNKGIEWYKQFFMNSEHYKIIGAITPSYLFFDYVPERIKNTLGTDIKFLIILRNPIDRAYSHYWMSYKRGYEKYPFEKAIIMEHARMRKGYFEKNHFSYLSRGFYSEQIKRYLSVFPFDNIKIIIFEEFIKNIKPYMKDILVFLGCHDLEFEFNIHDESVHYGDLSISQYLKAIKTNRNFIFQKEMFNLKKLIKNKRIHYPPLKKATRVFLQELYKHDIHELELLLKRDLSIWYKD
ncbi:MAG: sulfotransferase domain-containing protein [Thermoplasmata archaeon]